MTTIAWDGNTLAADSQCEGGYTFVVQKIFRTQHGLVAGAGDYGTCLRLKDRIDEQGIVWLEMPSECSLDVIVISNSGVLYMYDETGYPIPVMGRHAVGSGAPLAIAAMHCGKTAAEAVEVAATYDSKTGGEIQTATLQG